jgi:hypothetical protein
MSGNTFLCVIELEEKSLSLALNAIKEVCEFGYGEVRIIIKDNKILDIIPSPRIRVEEGVGKGRTHAVKSDGLDKR